jgi:hypothetical protein
VGGVFADAAEEDDAVDAGGDEFFEVRGGGGEVDGEVGVVLGGEGGVDAVPGDVHKLFSSSLCG